MSEENKRIKNILLTTMSVLNRNTKTNYYYIEENGIRLLCSGISTMEPGSKYVLHEHPIDEIIAIGTKETYNKEDHIETSDLSAEFTRLEKIEEVRKPLKELGKEIEETRKSLDELGEQLERLQKPLEQTEEACKLLTEFAEMRGHLKKLEKEHINMRQADIQELSAFEFYKYNIIRYLLNKDSESAMQPHKENVDRADKKALTIRFIPEQIEGSDGDIDDINSIVNAIYGTGEQEIHLYIDVQGGNRTSAHVRNTVLSILSNQYQDNIHIDAIMAVKFNPAKNEPSEIVDEMRRYRILDLASGMNAFIQYGKADMIEKYCKDMGIAEDSNVGSLVGYMVDIDEAISLCDITALETSIENMSGLLGNTDSSRYADDDFVGNVFNILTDGIKKDYGTLLDKPEVEYVELIAWCARKGFIQQALTLIEDKMPEVYFENGVLSYRFGNANDKRRFLSVLGQSYESESNRIFNSLKYEYLKQGKPSKPKQTDDYAAWQAYEIAKEEYENRLREKAGSGESVRVNLITNLKDDLIRMIKQEQTDFDKSIFIEKYCRFRRMEKAHEDGWGYTNNMDNVSILVCCGENNYIYGRNGNSIKITFRAFENRGDSEYKNLNQHLLLHEALKKERNCCNHASQNGVRLPIKVVKCAIELYVDNVREILS